ncbi:unnamed protein product [Schistocephalus solidus]|uniref:C2H2-type domain-containing protein n=1 Tax=Schistocephalus solidus TaxID=70667 RepID=A0A183T013_SCHSO|nr:unnamed protein product [Schistocephalus solidus]
MKLHWSGHLMRMNDERLPKQLFYGDVATSSRRQGSQVRCYKDTLKTSLKQLQINPVTWEDITRNRPAWRKTVKTGAAIYEANQITAAKAKRAARQSLASQINNANVQALQTCAHSQRTFRARVGVVGYLRMQCTNNSTIPNSAPNSVNPPSDYPTLTPGIKPTTPTIIETTSQYSFPITFSTTTAATTTTAISDGDCLLNCPQCECTFTARIGLVGHLRIHCTETGEPGPGAQHTAENAASTALTVLTHSLIGWAYSVTCASPTAEFTTMPTRPIPHAHPQILPFLPPMPPPLP